jgi:hypothetical protein
MTMLELQSLQAANRAREASLDPAAEQTIQRTIANLLPPLASPLWCCWVGGFDEIEMRFVCVK